MKPNKKKVLEALNSHFDPWEGVSFVCFKTLQGETGLDRKEVRRHCRALKRQGLAEFQAGLWDDEGRPAGSGYAATKLGIAWLKENGEQPNG